MMSEKRSLNPKLTRRKLAIDETNLDNQLNDLSESAVDDGSLAKTEATQSTYSTTKNPKKDLVHNGKWINKEFRLGRPVGGTGLWDCCGDLRQFSVYCESLEVRKIFPAKLEKLRKDIDTFENSSSESFQARTNRRRQALLEHIQKSQELSKRKSSSVQDENEGTAIDIEKKPILSKEEEVLAAVCSTDSTLNAPMLIAWLMRHYEEEPTTLNGLGFLLKHLQSGQGCVLMQRHGVVQAILKIQRHYSKFPNINPMIQKSVAEIMVQLLDCNFTRSEIIEPSETDSQEAEEVTATAFRIAHSNMNSRDHVEPALRALSQCCRSERCRVHILARNYPPYVVQLCRRHASSWSVCQSAIRILNWLSTDLARLEVVCRSKAVELSLSILRKHAANRPVVGAAAAFLARAGGLRPAALQVILARSAVPDVVSAIRLVHDDAGVQRELLRLLQVLSRTSDGFKQLDSMRGGWQVATQGTLHGDALLHSLPGPLNNPGWCLGEQPHLSALEKRAMEEKSAARIRNTVQAGPRSHWTTSSLQEFMGQSMQGKSLAINNERQEVFFELVTTLNLLPKTHHTAEDSQSTSNEREGREEWFGRLKEYERENGMQLDEMVTTVIDMRRRERQQKETQEAQATRLEDTDFEEVAKPLFVQGVQMTGLYLALNDHSAEEHMKKLAGE